MKIIIPMSGTGQRFVDAGYKVVKPLIVVDGKPIIEHVVNLFPGEKEFIFICNREHLKDTDMRQILSRIAPHSKIIEIAPHKKGPVYAVQQAFDLFDDDEKVIVNYCDFSKSWDYNSFLKDARTKDADGAISAYKGFHPHMLGKTNYAFVRDDKQWMIEIREKQPFTNNRMQEYASDGTYYFKKGSHVKKYFQQLMDEDINTAGEYYVSMVYNLMKRDGLKVLIHEIEHMLQWGTPRELEEYQKWSDYFARTIEPQKKLNLEKKSINLMPLAGKGKRFLEAGYKDPKPLVKVNGKPMIIRAVSHLPQAEKNIFVCLSEHLDGYPLEKEIKKVYPNSKIVKLDKVTEGQAITCRIGLEGEDSESPLLIAACDNGILWNRDKYQKLIGDEDVDVVVWSFKRYPSSERNPHMYGWIKVDDRGNVQYVSVKKAISSDPYNDHAIVGTFYFKKVKYFLEAVKRLVKNNARINNEFYVDSCVNELIKMGLRVKVFEADHYICWGTPDDLKIYEYWQSFFHKCNRYPYGEPKGALTVFKKYKTISGFLKDISDDNNPIRQLIKFSIVGAFGASVSYSIFYLLYRAFSVNHVISSSIGYFLSAATIFLFNRQWTFNIKQGNVTKNFVMFMILMILSFIVNSVSIYFFTDVIKLKAELSQIITMTITTIVNFMGSKFWVFKQKPTLPVQFLLKNIY